MAVFTHPATAEIYTLSLHDALPICRGQGLMCEPAHPAGRLPRAVRAPGDRKSTRLNSSHLGISYAVFCLKKKSNSWWRTVHVTAAAMAGVAQLAADRMMDRGASKTT